MCTNRLKRKQWKIPCDCHRFVVAEIRRWQAHGQATSARCQRVRAGEISARYGHVIVCGWSHVGLIDSDPFDSRAGSEQEPASKRQQWCRPRRGQIPANARSWNDAVWVLGRAAKHSNGIAPASPCFLGFPVKYDITPSYGCGRDVIVEITWESPTTTSERGAW